MSLEQMEGIIEAVLFTMGDSVEAGKLADAIEQDVDTTVKIVHNLMDKYESDNRGIRIIELENSFQLCTKQEYYEYLVKIALQPQKAVLTDVMLETLSIIAYRQPVTKADIEQVRGVKCDYSVQALLAKGLIEEAGRRETLGRPILYRTTDAFLRHFCISTLEELPQVDFKAPAEAMDT